MSTSFPLNGQRVRISGETDKGMKRPHNEDFLYLPDEERLVMVADGMGGHAAGDVASRLAVETIASFFHATANECDVTWPFLFDGDNKRQENRLITGFKLANLKIYDLSQQQRHSQGMGTTLVAGLFCEEVLILAHVGDSRIYRLRGTKIKQMTDDHSLLNDYIRMKRLKPEDADKFPHKNVIVRALGMKDTVAVDTVREQPQLGDIYLFCSDGLSGMLSDQGMLEIVRQHDDLDKACEALVAQANANGGVDNITVALARIERG